MICYTARTKKGYERAKEIAEALNRGETIPDSSWEHGNTGASDGERELRR